MAEPTPPILDLDTLIERPRIAIDGVSYEILSPDEISVIDFQRFAIWGQRIDMLMSEAVAGDAPEESEAELTRLIINLTDRIMVGVPEEVRDKLGEPHRMMIAEAFTRLPLPRWVKAAEGAKKKIPPIGAKQRQGSKGSTAGRRGGGSTKRPLPSCGLTT